MTSDDLTLGATALLVTTVEVKPAEFLETSITPHASYGSGDSRNTGTLLNLFDGDLNTKTSFANYPGQDGYIIYHLGTNRQVKSMRAYIQDGTINYLRDGILQVSLDGKTWIDVITVGDGKENTVAKDDSLGDGWTHDSNNPGNRYIEGTLDQAVEANYLRIFFTAPYNHRFVEFNEIVINNGEYVPIKNDPTVESSAIEIRNHHSEQMTDKNVLTSYKPNANQGQFTYRLSENTNHNHFTLVTSGQSTASIRMRARVSANQDGTESKWIDLGQVKQSFQRIPIADIAHLFEIQFV